jgi:hypothetical protein
MARSRASGSFVVGGPLRFGPLVLLLVATVAAAVTSVTTARPRSSPVAHSSAVRSPAATTMPVASTSTTTSTTPPSSLPDSAPVEWLGMTNDLELNPDSVACPSTTLCVFTGSATQFVGQQERAYAVSTGPFVPGAKITGHLTDLPQDDSEEDTDGPWYVVCPSSTACLMSSPDAIFATTSPRTGPWVTELTAPAGEGFGDISCAGTTFCAVLLGNDILISRNPLGGEGTWSTTGLMDGASDEEGVGALSCPSPQFCVAGGSAGETGGFIEESTDPGGGPGAWSGGDLTDPPYAQHSGEYSITDVSCPTVAFCVASQLGAPLLVSTNPTGGPATWAPAPLADDVDSTNPGVASCGADGSCVVSGVGVFASLAGAAGPGFTGHPQMAVSCVSASFCISIDSVNTGHFEVGGTVAPT